MKAIIFAAATILLTGSVLAQEAKPGLTNQKEKSSYAIGLDIGSNMRKQGLDLDTNSFQRGMKDGLAGATSQLNEKETAQVMEQFQKDMMAKEKTKGESAKKAGEEFLQANKKKEGVKVTASGLQYKVIKQGTGPKPKPTDVVKVNYRGTLIDGTEFDSSYKRNEPATFPLNRVIPGWTEGLQLMPVGSKYQFVIPADLAYGERGAGASVPPNSTLIFDVELLSIEKENPADKPK